MVGKKLVTSKTSVNLVVWNINGVKSKLINKFEDTSFINNIKCYDIIGLVETHLVESLPAPLKNYNIHHTYRKQNVKTKRNFGGISVLIKKTIVVLKYMKIQTVTLYG